MEKGYRNYRYKPVTAYLNPISYPDIAISFIITLTTAACTAGAAPHRATRSRLARALAWRQPGSASSVRGRRKAKRLSGSVDR